MNSNGPDSSATTARGAGRGVAGGQPLGSWALENRDQADRLRVEPRHLIRVGLLASDVLEQRVAEVLVEEHPRLRNRRFEPGNREPDRFEIAADEDLRVRALVERLLEDHGDERLVSLARDAEEAPRRGIARDCGETRDGADGAAGDRLELLEREGLAL